jgi:nucleotide-binding universal stress UspA family protein
MYDKILVTLDATAADKTILAHIRLLAKQCRSRLVLLHVADGWAARTYGADAVHSEITEDRAYLAGLKAELEAEGFSVEAELAYGDPAAEIVRWVRANSCDLVAMSTHGHRLLGDLLHGSTAHQVQHRVDVPVLLIKMRK